MHYCWTVEWSVRNQRMICVAEVVSPSWKQLLLGDGIHICGEKGDLHVEQQGHTLGFLPMYVCTSIPYISVHCIAMMVGFDQPTYAFDEDASTGQVCITFTGDLASTISPNIGLILVGETAEGVLFSVQILDERQVWH